MFKKKDTEQHELLCQGEHKERVRGHPTNNADLDIKSDKGETKRVGGVDPLRKCGGVLWLGCQAEGGGVKSPSGVVSH